MGQANGSAPPQLPDYARALRRHDPDRFLTALFAPAARRDTLMLLYAFNHELARAREVAREPTLALIRLQWWREVVQGAGRQHEVATPLAHALAAGMLHRPDLLAMIEGREIETDPSIPTTDAWRDYVHATAGALAVAAGRLLGADAATSARLRLLGSAYGVAGQLRNVGALARQGRCLLPASLLGAWGLTPDTVIAAPTDARLAPVRTTLASWGRDLLDEAGGFVPRPVVAAALPAVLARRDLARIAQPPGPRGFGDRAAVTLAAMLGRV